VMQGSFGKCYVTSSPTKKSVVKFFYRESENGGGMNKDFYSELKIYKELRKIQVTMTFIRYSHTHSILNISYLNRDIFYIVLLSRAVFFF